jgi:hypothetical protein
MRALFGLLVALALLPAPAYASHLIRLVTFDTDAYGNTLSDNDPVNAAYLPWGILFQAVGPGSNCGPSVYARDNFHPAGFGSDPNVVSTCAYPSATDISEEFFHSIQATFGPPASRVCVDVWPLSGSHQGVLRGYDELGVEIGSVESTPGAVETICLGGIGSIHSVRMNGKQSLYARFDDLEVTFEDGAVDVPASAELPSGLRVEAAFPNPVRNTLRLAVVSSGPLPIRVEVVDLAGRLLLAEEFLGLGAGARQIDVPAVAGLSPGVYYARVSQGGSTAGKSFVVLR